jgi:competence protein ComEC
MVKKTPRSERTRIVPGLRNIPFLRIFIPFLLGIICCIVFRSSFNAVLPLFISFTLLAVLFFNNRSRFGIQQNTKLFILAADIFLFLAAIQCCYLNDIKNNKNYYGHYIGQEKQIWSGEIIELPVEKENFIRIMVEVKAFKDAPAVCGKTILYLKKPYDVSFLEPGTRLNIKSTFIPVQGPMNPHEFNYKEFLARKNIYYTCFAGQGDVEIAGHAQDFSLIYFGSEIKKRILETFTAPALDKEASQLCSALLTGYDDEISPETINAFAHSGTLHVLSVSGLHTGILYTVLVFVLGIIDRNKKYRLLQLIVITLVLWGFVFITGFSPPVLRAAIMLNLIATGRFYYSYASHHGLNILAVSAFIILVFDPLLIMDAGFLLSYFAVAGILLFEPPITRLVGSRYWIVNKTWQLTSVSLAAQISTLPITLFLFHQFPVWFVFSNLIVIPLCIGLMALAFLFLVKLTFLAPLINLSSAFIFFTIHLTDSPGIGYIDHIDFGLSDLLFLAALIISTALFIKSNSYTHAAAAFSLLIIWQIFSLIEAGSKKASSHIAVYQIKKQSAIDLKNNSSLLFLNGLSRDNYNYHVNYNHAFLNYPEINVMKMQFMVYGNSKFLCIDDPAHSLLIKHLKPDHIVVRNNLELPEEILKDVKPKLIIADGSNNYPVLKKLKALCDKFAIPFYSTAKSGYIQIEL